MASSTRISASAGTSDGVPPPKNTLVAAGMPSATRSVDLGDARVEVGVDQVVRSVHVANAQ